MIRHKVLKSYENVKKIDLEPFLARLSLLSHYAVLLGLKPFVCMEF